MQETNCPLCLKESNNEYFSAEEKVYGVLKFKQYFKCQRCSLVYLNSKLRVSLDQEKARYLEHKNDSSDKRYCQFLLQAWGPLEKYVSKSGRGLDFGCGHQPVLAQIIKEKGYQIDHYDPFFFNTNITGLYDYILSTEVIEHVCELDLFFEKLNMYLKPGGYLSLMTDWLTDKVNFSNWRYRDDPTHICFFSEETFDYISSKYKLKPVYNDKKRVIIFQK